MRIIPLTAVAVAFGGLAVFTAPASGQSASSTPTSAAGQTDSTTRTDSSARKSTPASRRRASNASMRTSADANADASMQTTRQGGCVPAPAVANAYIRDQVSAGHKLTMARGAVISQITQQTGADGEFAGLRPCDSGYPNAVRFYIDEVIKAGTNNSTP
ncbi:MAG: hypothetical protein ACJ8AC_13500 [Gemmatimonadaceae bacterium]